MKYKVECPVCQTTDVVGSKERAECLNYYHENEAIVTQVKEKKRGKKS